MKAGKSGVIEKNPNTQTIKFGDQWINQSAIARAQGLDQSYVSRIFNGQRTPSLQSAQKIAAMLGMTLDQFVEALATRKKELAERNERILTAHRLRLDSEDRADLQVILGGGVPAPRLPALRQRSA